MLSYYHKNCKCLQFINRKKLLKTKLEPKKVVRHNWLIKKDEKSLYRNKFCQRKSDKEATSPTKKGKNSTNLKWEKFFSPLKGVNETKVKV